MSPSEGSSRTGPWLVASAESRFDAMQDIGLGLTDLMSATTCSPKRSSNQDVSDTTCSMGGLPHEAMVNKYTDIMVSLEHSSEGDSDVLKILEDIVSSPSVADISQKDKSRLRRSNSPDIGTEENLPPSSSPAPSSVPFMSSSPAGDVNPSAPTSQENSNHWACSDCDDHLETGEPSARDKCVQVSCARRDSPHLSSLHALVPSRPATVEKLTSSGTNPLISPMNDPHSKREMPFTTDPLLLSPKPGVSDSGSYTSVLPSHKSLSLIPFPVSPVSSADKSGTGFLSNLAHPVEDITIVPSVGLNSGSSPSGDPSSSGCPASSLISSPNRVLSLADLNCGKTIVSSVSSPVLSSADLYYGVHPSLSPAFHSPTSSLRMVPSARDRSLAGESANGLPSRSSPTMNRKRKADVGKRTMSSPPPDHKSGSNKRLRRDDTQSSPPRSLPVPVPKRPTLASQQVSRRKLVTPFRSPLMAKVVPWNGTSASEHDKALSSGQGINTGSPPHKSEPGSRSPANVNRTMTKLALASRAASQFKSPFGGSSNSQSRTIVLPTAKIQSLERQVMALRRAVKIKRDGDEEKLKELMWKWTEVGREAAYELWGIVRDFAQEDVGADKQKTGEWGWGWDERESGKVTAAEGIFQDGGAITDEVVEEKEKEEETIGLMLRRIGITPETLGWSAEVEDFVDN